MAKKQYFMIVDTESTINNLVADFAAIIVDSKGIIHNECAILVKGIFDQYDLFHNTDLEGIWTRRNLESRVTAYTEKLKTGKRLFTTVDKINAWLEKANTKYAPTLTAYNLAYDANLCDGSKINLAQFSERFCLWHAATGNICNTRKYHQFALENHYFTKPTKLGNMSILTNAECVAHFVRGKKDIEPHTAREDLDFELDIFKHLIKKRKYKQGITPYNWRDHQVKAHYKAK